MLYIDDNIITNYNIITWKIEKKNITIIIIIVIQVLFYNALEKNHFKLVI